MPAGLHPPTDRADQAASDGALIIEVRSFEEFRRWLNSPEFPQSGRVEYLGNHIETDMSPEELFHHNAPKNELIRALTTWNRATDAGEVLSDGVRVTCASVGLSVEPDVLFLSHRSLDSGAVTFKPGTVDETFVEVDGPPDLVVEIVSRSSVAKDRHRLPPLYFAAGVQEYWLLDARAKPPQLTVHRRGDAAFIPVDAEADGFQPSSALASLVRFDRADSPRGRPVYTLHIREV